MITLDQAKDQLRIRSNDKDDLLADLVNRAAAILQTHCGEGYDAYAEDLDAAQVVLVEWMFRPEDEIDLDDVYGLPRAMVSLARPYRKLGLG